MFVRVVSCRVQLATSLEYLASSVRVKK
ncbi:hypothetical protein E2C01_075876 [Portunus trituberculatus]|uniref:Uncharacterized protein n=1 Tax=Portunus trituberculatus TaxID=210409 RepID=A0A5B7IHH5_PORTR|nr:hypothetical protein [Portunus trituberculatus]